MEDNSDTNRDTDVSSTTADVPETQEVTGSNGNVEMIITVEKIEEESDDGTTSSQPMTGGDEVKESLLITAEPSQKEEAPTNNKETQQNISSQTVTTSPRKDISSPKTVINLPTTTSPTKVINTSIIVIPPITTPTKESNTTKSDDTPPKSDDLKQTSFSPMKDSDQTVDSSCKTLSSCKDNVQVNNDISKETPIIIETENEAEKIETDSPIATSSEDILETSAHSLGNQATEGNGNDGQKSEKSLKAPIENHCDKSNDSQLDTSSEVSEKEHNKSISRELKSLIKSAKESKIISECTQLTSKTRKSRTPLDPNISLNTSVDAEKILNVRRNSNISSKSNCSEKSEKAAKRSMRSQNPEFVNKVKQFLNSVTGKTRDSDDDLEQEPKKDCQNEESPVQKKKKVSDELQVEVKEHRKLRVDPYCWRCHWALELGSNEKSRPPMQCTVCPRVFHYKCLSIIERSKIDVERSWVCPECLAILHAESSETRSLSMKKISLGLLCELLQYALTRMMELNGVEPFMQPVDRSAFPDYDKYVVHPMDLSLMKNNIASGLYGSTEAFLADAQWILHNSIIFNTFPMATNKFPVQSKLTLGARALVRLCRSEMGEIEACPECYAAAHARRPTWFTDVCSTPHILLWAKLKGFPYWPAKGMSVNSSGVVDVRFFGAHDRAWVPAKDCFLYSEKDPNNIRTKKQILDSMQEAEQHIRNISRKYGKFVYPPFKTPFEPSKITEQLKSMIPTFEGELKFQIREKLSTTSPKVKEKRRSNSKSSKSSVVDGEISENEEIQVTPSTEGSEINKNEDYTIESENTMDVDETKEKAKKPSRKRRRSQLEEAVITIIESSKEKRRRIDKTPVTPKQNKLSDVAAAKEKSDKVNYVKITSITKKDKKSKLTNEKESKEVPNSTTDKDEMAVITPVTSTPKAVRSRRARSVPKTIDNKEKAEKNSTPKQKLAKIEKISSNDKEKVEEIRKEKKRISRRKSCHIVRVYANDKTPGKKSTTNASKTSDKVVTISDDNDCPKNTDLELLIDKNIVSISLDKPKGTKDRIQFDDDTTLAVLAQEPSKTGMPTISSVRSLSEKQPENSNDSNLIEVTVDANSNASIFTPTSTDSVRNMKEAADKLQKLKESDPPVGRVGVRAFARMKSTETSPKSSNKTPEIEIKSEPIDFGDSERQIEKLDLMNSFRLQPVNPPVNRLREVRINKLVVTPISRKAAPKTPDVRVKAKKSFPQPKKVDERSELTSKNSMVYIPIQPASAQAPVRPTRPVAVNGVSQSPPARLQAPTSAGNSSVNTMTTPLVPSVVSSSVTSLSNKTTTTSVLSSPNASKVGQMPLPSLGAIPAIGQLPTSVPTVPFISSVNGQWHFSLQPVMSVGGVDNSSNGPVVNGIGERSIAGTLVAFPTPVSVNTVLPQAGRKDDGTAQLPRLQHKPLMNPFDAATPQGLVPAPSTVGPLTAKLNQNAVKLADFFRTLLEDSLDKVNEPAAHVTSLKMQLEQLQWKHKQELDELRHNHELSIVEMRASFEREKTRAVAEVRRAAQLELENSVKTTKGKQWCANCLQEAQFYCCWNTSYCDYPCQRAHWTQHAPVCTQPRSQDNNGKDSNSTEIHTRLQPAPDRHAIQKNATIPTLSVGGKSTGNTRVYTSEQLHPKTSLIVSVVEDGSGNQTVKCVGTYKSPNTQVSPIVINKQMINSDEASAKKVTTSGGYLIVGGGTTVTAPRRPTTIQYLHTT